jgi:hypothetical protein
MSADTIACKDLNGYEYVINIPEKQKGTLNGIEPGDTIIIGYDFEVTNPCWIDLLKKAETTGETTTVSETTVTEDTSSNNPVTVPGDVQTTLLGDVNGDDEIDVRDVTMLKQNIVKLVALDTQQTANADVITDNIIDVKDLGQLIKYIIKVIDKF